MKIFRRINGMEVEFELTDEELSAAYYEQEFIFDIKDVEDVLTHMIADGYPTGVTIPVKQSELFALVPQIASKFRSDMNKYCDEWWDFAESAIKEVLVEKYGSI